MTSGFDDLSMPGVGYWIRERVWSREPAWEEVHHSFVLTTGPDPCVAWFEDPPPEYMDPPPGTDPVMACEQYRAYHAALAVEGPRPDELVFVFALHSTVRGVEPHMDLAPVASSSVPIAAPGADAMKFTLHGSRVLFDWNARWPAMSTGRSGRNEPNTDPGADGQTRGTDTADGATEPLRPAADALPTEELDLFYLFSSVFKNTGCQRLSSKVYPRRFG